jgi:hypothetical protein
MTTIVKKKKIHTKSKNRKIVVERGKINIPDTQTNDRPRSLLGTIKSGKASKDNTIANPHIYLRRNWVILNKTSLALMFTSDLKKNISFIIKSTIFCISFSCRLF